LQTNQIGFAKQGDNAPAWIFWHGFPALPKWFWHQNSWSGEKKKDSPVIYSLPQPVNLFKRRSRLSFENEPEILRRHYV
jgi:hypothetical protein